MLMRVLVRLDRACRKGGVDVAEGRRGVVAGEEVLDAAPHELVGSHEQIDLRAALEVSKPPSAVEPEHQVWDCVDQG